MTRILIIEDDEDIAFIEKDYLEVSGYQVTVEINGIKGLTEALTGEYDLILSTVVMMFLEPDTIPGLIANMQRCTAAGGYNLIVAAMDTEDYPCTVGFPFAFKPDELRDYYQGWELLKYNEDVGELHRTDANGNRIKLRFATLLARKPA